MSNQNVVIVPEQREHRGTPYTQWVIRRDGVFIIASNDSEAEAKRLLALLEQSDWKHLDCYERGHPDPLEWIEYVRSQGWTFENFTKVQICEDGRSFFSGNLNEYSGAFRYLILDEALLQRIRDAAPEVQVTH